MLIGHARTDALALDYVVRADDGFATLDADVTGTVDGAAVSWKIAQAGGDWTLNGAEVPGLRGAVDVDLSFTPATNLLPLRRLPLGADWTDVTAAWFVPGDETLRPLDQGYRRIGPDRVAYRAATGFAADLTVAASGFVTHYPGLWTGEVEDVD